MRSLDGGDARLLGDITIIGTKYCAGGYDYLIQASRAKQPEEQCLFLVADVKSNDVMLHNGKIRLGTVAPTQVEAVRQVIKKHSDHADAVLVCRKAFVPTAAEWSIRNGSSFNIDPVYVVYERLARKFSDKYRW